MNLQVGQMGPKTSDTSISRISVKLATETAPISITEIHHFNECYKVRILMWSMCYMDLQLQRKRSIKDTKRNEGQPFVYLPAPTNEEFDTAVMPWAALSVTPILAKPTAKILLMVAICITDCRLAALSAWIVNQNVKASNEYHVQHKSLRDDKFSQKRKTSASKKLRPKD